MSASGIRAGQAYVKIATEQSLFDRGVAQVQASMRRLASVANTIGGTVGSGFGTAAGAMRSFAGGLASLPSMLAGLAAGGGLAMLATTFAEAAGSVDDMAQRTGMVAEDISTLSYAAKMSGTSIGAVEKAIRKMQVSGKSTGAGAAADFKMYADQIAAIEDPAQRAAEAQRIFGKAGVELLPMLANGSAGIDKMAGKAAELGVVMSTADATAGAALGDSMDQLWMTLSGLTNQIGAALAPALTWLIDQGTAVIATVSNWIAENKNLIANFLVLENAGKLVMLGIEVAWRSGIQPLYNLWQDFQVWLVGGIADAVVTLTNVFASIPTALMNGFSTAITWLTGTWDQTVNYIAKKLLYLYSLFDASVDYEATAKQMDADAAGRAKSRQQSLGNANAKRNADQERANAERRQFTEQFKATVGDIGQERKTAFDARLETLKGEMANIYDGMKQQADSIAAAQSSPATTAALSGGGATIPGMGAVSAVTARTAGAFSGFAAGFLGGGVSAIDRLVDNGKKTNELLKAIADNTGEDDALEFDA